MKRRVSSSFDSLTAFLHVAVCVVSVAMLLSFPAAKVHNFGAHFRTPEVRRSTERHTSVAQSEGTTDELVARAILFPTFFAPAESVGKIVPLDNFEPPSNAAQSRPPIRRKLCARGSGAQDPLT
jgi:hypothetical protein